MVQTRSQRRRSSNTTSQENTTAKPPTPRSKSQPRSPSKSKRSTNVFMKYLAHFCFWKPTSKTWTLYSCFVGFLMIGCLCHTLHTTFIDDDINLMFFWTLITAVTIDLISNIILTLEINIFNFFNDDLRSDFTLFTESMVQCIQLIMILQGCNISNSFNITIVLLLQLCNLVCQIKYQDSESAFVRGLSNLPLFIVIVFYWNIAITIPRIRLFLFANLLQSLIDGMDFPDKYFDQFTLCEAIIMKWRLIATYFIATSRILQLHPSEDGFVGCERSFVQLFQ